MIDVLFQRGQKYRKVFESSLKTQKSEEPKKDISALQLSNDDATFSASSILFLKKRSSLKNSQITEFIDYFEKLWTAKYMHMYEGTAEGYLSTNNGIKATNAVIKRDHTLRERLIPVGEFLTQAGDIIFTWSQSRDPKSTNVKHFSTTLSISLPDWTKA